MIKVDSGKTIQVDGGLVAIGEPDQQIILTSNTDNPAPGDWIGIQFMDSSVDAVICRYNYFKYPKQCIESIYSQDNAAVSALV